MSNVGASIIRGLEQAAENRIEWSETLETMPQGLKPRLTLCGLLARMNPCPFKTASSMEFFRSLLNWPSLMLKVRRTGAGKGFM
jgi:hypothetical protein